MVARILLTAAPWYICGYTAYLMTAWICLEPTWKLRIVNLLIAAGIVRIFFLLDKPEAYNSFLPTLIIFTILCASLSSGRLSDSKKVAKTNFKNGILQ